MEKMQAMTEMNVVEICHRITQVERALTCTKEFSIKFNGHLKLITSLVNSLYEEEESLILFEQKIEKRADHFHKRVYFLRERNGEDRVIMEDEAEAKGSAWGVQNEYGGFDGRPSATARGDMGKGLVGNWNGEQPRARGFSRGGMARSMENTADPEFEQMKRKEQMEIRSEYQGKGYRQNMDHLGQGMEKGKRGALVNEFPFATVDSIDEQQQRTDEEMAMSKKLDMFMKESDLLREVIKNGESNAKHLKECLFKLIDAFKDQSQKKSSSNTKVEKVEKIIKEGAGGKKNHRLDINIHHNMPGKDGEVSIPTNTGYEDMMQEISRLRDQLGQAEAENERLRNRGSSPDDRGLRGRMKQLRKELDEAEDGHQSLRSQNKKLRRENQELKEDLEDLNRRLDDLRNKTQNQVDAGALRKAEKEAGDAWGKVGNLEDELERLNRKLRELERTGQEDRERLEREKEEAVEKTYKTIVELKTENEEEMERMREDVLGKDKIIKSLMEELRKIKDYISKLEREIFDLSQEKEKLEENLKKVMYEWESEELKRYSSDKQINGKLKGKDDEIQELKEKLQQIDSFHQEAKNEINRKADFYKKKSENLERKRNELNRQVEKLEKTLKHRRQEAEPRGSHVEIGSMGVRTMEEGNDFGKTRDTKASFRAEGDYEYERRQQVNQTVRMDGDLIKMIYTQANLIEEQLLDNSESEEDEDEVQEYKAYAPQGAPVYVDNTQSGNPQQGYANANRVILGENGEKYMIESEADDGEKMVAAYVVNGQYMPITQMGQDVQEIPGHLVEARVPMNVVQQGGVMVDDPNLEHHEEEYDEQGELIEDEYSDMENEQMYAMHQGVQEEDHIGNGNLVSGPVGGGMREEYEEEEGEEIDYDEADGEEDFEDEDEDGLDYHEEDFHMAQEQPNVGDNYHRKPALTFGMGQK